VTPSHMHASRQARMNKLSLRPCPQRFRPRQRKIEEGRSTPPSTHTHTRTPYAGTKAEGEIEGKSLFTMEGQAGGRMEGVWGGGRQEGWGGYGGGS